MSKDSSPALPPSGSAEKREGEASDLEPPGGVLVWMIVFLELITFGAGLAVFLYQKGQAGEEFAAGNALLSQRSAVIRSKQQTSRFLRWAQVRLFVCLFE